MSRDFIPTWFFALVVVRMGRRFLIVQESDEKWYLPGGRTEPGEKLVETAHRETLEEGGIPIVIEGIFHLQHTPRSDGTTRVRVIFVARPQDDTPPKSEADEDTLRARWVTLEELDDLTLRSEEVRHIFQEISLGAPIYPLAILGKEG